jgi:hypothetical protein
MNEILLPRSRLATAIGSRTIQSTEALQFVLKESHDFRELDRRRLAIPGAPA